MARVVRTQCATLYYIKTTRSEQASGPEGGAANISAAVHVYRVPALKPDRIRSWQYGSINGGTGSLPSCTCSRGARRLSREAAYIVRGRGCDTERAALAPTSLPQQPTAVHATRSATRPVWAATSTRSPPTCRAGDGGGHARARAASKRRALVHHIIDGSAGIE